MDGSPLIAAEPRVTLDSPDCHVCGYSRNGLPQGALCPECGQPPDPATFVLYRYLASLAAGGGDDSKPGKAGRGGAALCKCLGRLAFAAWALILSPLAFFAVSAPLRDLHRHPAALASGAAYGALVLSAGIIAWAAVARLIW